MLSMLMWRAARRFGPAGLATLILLLAGVLLSLSAGLFLSMR
jgi:hypothetical protein